jgi:hypothetical protein
MPDPLAIHPEKWRSRWLQFTSTRRNGDLHRVASIAWDGEALGFDPGDMIQGEGVSVCGKEGRMAMPGIFSRMGAPRCRRCCKAMGIPPGDGPPWNAVGETWRNA